jgi:hypothetical protein
MANEMIRSRKKLTFWKDNNSLGFVGGSMKQKHGVRVKTGSYSPPDPFIPMKVRADNFLEMPRKPDNLKRKKHPEPPREVSDPSQPLAFAVHVKAIAEEGDGLLKTVPKGTQAHLGINLTYRELIGLLVEADNFSHHPLWEKDELRGLYALDLKLDRTIQDMKKDGHENLPALTALKQEVHARVGYLTAQHTETYEKETESNLERVLKQKSNSWEKGN